MGVTILLSSQYDKKDKILYMEDFEEQALASAPTAPKIYIDDTFTIWKRNDVEDFLHTASHHSTTNHPFYNGDWEWQHNSLSWHIGHKRFRKTPHTTSVYQKPKHTDQYLSYDTQHSISLTMCCQALIRCIEKYHH